jgi:hypothetical protein
MKILLIFVLALILPLSVAASEPEDLKKIKDGQCPGCDLWGVNLEDADLHGANLHGANLKASDLRNATLTNADLVGGQPVRFRPSGDGVLRRRSLQRKPQRRTYPRNKIQWRHPLQHHNAGWTCRVQWMYSQEDRGTTEKEVT